jgi:H+/gluconate symporter-like permease
MHKVNIPRRFIVALIILGSTTGGLLPGSPSILNIFGGQFLGTPPTASPILAITGALFIIILSIVGLSRMWEKDIANGLNFEFGPLTKADFDEEKQPPWFFLIFPVVTIFVCYNILKLSAFFALLIGLAVGLIFLFRYLPYNENEFRNSVIGRTTALCNSFNSGAEIAGIPAIILINMALGNLISATPAFDWFVQLFSNVHGSPVLLFTGVSILIIGVSASVSGIIVMYNLANELFIPVLGLDAAFIHRMVGFSGCVLDTLPFGTMVVALLLLTGLKQKEGYPPVLYATVGVTFVACIFVSILAVLGVR